MEELFSKEFEREDVVYLRPNFNPAIPKVIFNDIDLFIFKYELITGKKITKKIIGNQAIRDFTKLSEFEQEKNIPLLKIIEEYDNENRAKFSFVPTKDISEEFRKLEYFYQAQDKNIQARDIHALILLRFLDKVRKCTEYQMGKLGQFESVLFDNAIEEEHLSSMHDRIYLKKAGKRTRTISKVDALTVYFDDEMKHTLSHVSEKHKNDKTDFIRVALHEFFDRHIQPNNTIDNNTIDSVKQYVEETTDTSKGKKAGKRTRTIPKVGALTLYLDDETKHTLAWASEKYNIDKIDFIRVALQDFFNCHTLPSGLIDDDTMNRIGQYVEETTVKSYPELEQSKYDLISETNQAEVKEGLPKYTDADFLREVFTTADSLEEMKHLLRRKKNIILQGAPGVGKTFSAKRLAYAMMGEKNDDNIGLVQFHQNYSYEDFIMGYKPEDGDFKLKEGVFFRFCRKALSDPAHDYFFIIDEINRGNMSKIFGELLMLIEKDYRGTYATLPYREERFTVPKNVYLIGMMNTADRSLAMIDYALRRRFSFVEMQPGFDSEGFRAYQESLHSELFDRVVALIKQLNKEICGDDTLGAGFHIGHSYLCGIKPENCNEALLKEIVKYDILPTLSEYWFDDTEKIKKWTKSFNDLFA